jgi:hypothetical protein
MSEPTRELPADFDPRPEQRELVRSASTGELGWLVRRSGESMVRLDRPNQEILKRYVAGEWLPEVPQRPLARQQLARVAFEADRELCRSLGAYAHALRTWSRMDDHQRKVWAEKGPDSPAARVTLYKSIMAGMDSYTRSTP